MIYTATIRFLPCFTAAIHMKRLRPLPLGPSCCRGGFSCLLGVPNRSGCL